MKYSTLVLALFLNQVEAHKLNTNCPDGDSDSRLKTVLKALGDDASSSKSSCNTCGLKTESASEGKSAKKAVTKAIKKMEEKTEKKEAAKDQIKAIKKVEKEAKKAAKKTGRK